MALTLADLCDGIATTLATTPGVTSQASYDEMQEGIAVFDCPYFEVYPDSGNCDPSGNTDRTTFNAGTQQTIIVVSVDLFTSMRSELPDDMKDLVTIVDAMIGVLQDQEKPPFFGIDAKKLKAFSWSWRRATHVRSQGVYMGARFTLNCRIY